MCRRCCGRLAFRLQAQMMKLMDNQLEITTKRTIMENEQMHAELAYQSRQSEKIAARNKQLGDENADLRRRVELAKQTEASRRRGVENMVCRGFGMGPAMYCATNAVGPGAWVTQVELAKRNHVYQKTIKTLLAKIRSETKVAETEQKEAHGLQSHVEVRVALCALCIVRSTSAACAALVCLCSASMEHLVVIYMHSTRHSCSAGPCDPSCIVSGSPWTAAAGQPRPRAEHHVPGAERPAEGGEGPRRPARGGARPLDAATGGQAVTTAVTMVPDAPLGCILIMPYFMVNQSLMCFSSTAGRRCAVPDAEHRGHCVSGAGPRGPFNAGPGHASPGVVGLHDARGPHRAAAEAPAVDAGEGCVYGSWEQGQPGPVDCRVCARPVCVVVPRRWSTPAWAGEAPARRARWTDWCCHP